MNTKKTTEVVSSTKTPITKEMLRRTKQAVSDATELEGGELPAVSAGAIDRVIDFAFNPSRDKIREVTIIDRIQGRLLPQLDIIALMWQNVIEIAAFRQDTVEYAKVYKRTRPVAPDLHDEFIYRTAQWQKSVAGKNLERATDIALAEIETRSGEGDDYNGGADAWKD